MVIKFAIVKDNANRLILKFNFSEKFLRFQSTFSMEIFTPVRDPSLNKNRYCEKPFESTDKHLIYTILVWCILRFFLANAYFCFLC